MAEAATQQQQEDESMQELQLNDTESSWIDTFSALDSKVSVWCVGEQWRAPLFTRHSHYYIYIGISTHFFKE